MPIYLDIMSRLDDAAARKAADQAKKYFGDAGKSVGQDFGKAVSEGMASSDAAVRKLAESTEKAYKKAADAAGVVRVEEAKLEDLRTKHAGTTAILAETEKLEKARRAEASTAHDAVSALKDLDSAHIRAGDSGSLLAGVLQGIAQAGSGTRIGGIAASVEGIGTGALVAATGIAALGAGVAATVKGVYDLGSMWHDVGVSITGATGKIGTDLQGIVNTVQEVGKQSAISFQDIAQLAGGVSQSLHLTGEEATAVTQKLADIQQVTKQGIDTKELGKAFRLFDINDAQSEISTLGQLTAASQATNVPINDLVTSLTTTGKASKEAGLNLQQTLGVMLSLEEAGVSFEKAGSALTRALTHWAKQGVDANKALADTITQIKKLIDAGNVPAAEALAAKVFGAKTGWVDFFNAIKDGTLDVKTLTGGLSDLTDTLDAQKKSQEDGTDGWDKLKHSVESFLKPVADTVFKGINSELQYMTGHLNEATDSVNTLASSINSIKPDALAAAMGLPGMPGGPAALGPPTTQPGTPTTGLGPNFYKDWYKTPEELKKDAAQNSKLPDAPVLPYNTSLPQGFSGVPQTSSIVSAENSWMDARHTLEEKQARLNQLEHDNNAKASDVQKARNDVVNAGQAQNQAELSLYDARQSLYDKENKQLKAHTDALGEFGAKLDQDFGISKGLPGIAENLTKFLGNLIAAPFLSQMNALSNAPGQAQGGFGLMGMLGAQGVFGSQYTAAGQAAAANGSSAPTLGAPVGLSSGLPAPVSNTHGSHPQIAQIAAIAQSFGLQFTAGKDDHAADGGYHPKGMAGDFSNSSGNSAQELAFAQYMAQNFGPMLQELIYSDPSFNQLIGGGKNVTGTGYYSQRVLAEHTNHVHVAMTDEEAAALSGTPTGANNMPTGPASGSQQQAAAEIIRQAQAHGWNRDQTIAALSTGLQESGLNESASGGGGAWHGVFQQDTSYPGRDNMSSNIQAFFDRQGTPTGDPWSQIFALQQGSPYNSPGARKGYMSEIQSHIPEATSLFDSLAGAPTSDAGGGSGPPGVAPGAPVAAAATPSYGGQSFPIPLPVTIVGGGAGGGAPGAAQGGSPPAPGGGGGPGGPLFSSEGPDFYKQAFAHNSPFATPSSTNWQTSLPPNQEKSFRDWVQQNNVPFDPNAPINDYDMRGFFQSGGAKSWSPGSHFPDTFKTPYDTTFSGESKYAKPGTPFTWQGDNLVDTRTGQVVFGTGGSPGAPGAAPDPYSPANTNPALNNPLAPGAAPAPAAGPPGIPPPGGAPAQNPLDIFGPGTGHPGPPQIGGGGNAFGAGAPMGGQPGAGPTQIGGVDPLQGTGKGGVGITPGGSLDTALGLAASAFPGLGQAAQTGVKLASRAIQFGGQAAGILTQGALDTFLPFGGSKLAQNGWLTKIVGGIAGAAPALPNMAGKAAAPAKDQNQQNQGQGGQGGDTHITVNNNRPTEDGTGKDIAYHMGQQQLPAGKP